LQCEQRAWDFLMQGADNYLAGPATQLREAGIAVQTEVRPSLAADQIIAVAAGEQAATTQELTGLAEQLSQHIIAA
jgi:hypothetical protein